MTDRRELLKGTVIDDICCIIAEREKMIEGLMRGLISESDVEMIVRTRKETAMTIYRLVLNSLPKSGSYYHMTVDDAKRKLESCWLEILVNAATTMATSPFTTPDDLRELKRLMEEASAEQE